MKMKQLVLIISLIHCTHLFAQSMHDAIKSGDIKSVQTLIESDAELLSKKYTIEKPINRFTPKEISPLFDAIQYGRYEIVEYLIIIGIFVVYKYHQITASLYLVATNAAMYRFFRTSCRPPWINRLPIFRPLSRLKGATPTSAAM